jgi:hypothetical protein
MGGIEAIKNPATEGFSKNLPKIPTSVEKIEEGLNLDASDEAPEIPPVSTPWSAQPNSFFNPVEIEGKRWNELFPYRLLVVDTKTNTVVTKSGNPTVNVIYKKGVGTRMLFENFDEYWDLQLPITPQQLQITTQFAIGVSATQNGIVEEHGGVRFKNIMCSGTMGVWAQRPSVGKSPENQTWIQTLFGGTLNAVTNLTNQVETLARSVTQNHPAAKPTSVAPPNDGQGTGYVYAMLWDQFLEQYAEAKKDPTKASWRLVFDIPKQNQSFIVTPVQFTWNQSVENPNEIRYSFQLKAWKRIKLAKGIEPEIFDDLVKLSPNVLQRALIAIENARRVVGAATNVVKAVRSDFQTPFNALRQVSLLIKDLVGLPLAIIDLPRQIFSDYRSQLKDVIQDMRDKNEMLEEISKGWGGGNDYWMGRNKKNEGIKSASVESGQNGTEASNGEKTDPTNKIFESPEEHFDLFNSINIYDLSLTPEQQSRINSLQTDPATITVDDLLKSRQQLLELALQISNFFGSGDSYFSSVYKRSAPYVRSQEVTIDEYQILQSIYDAIQEIDNLTATQQIDDGRIATAMEYVGGVANANDIPFETSQSKIKVPVPYGLSIEEIAARYLGNSDRWIEIVTLNALKSPYIDEDGFVLPLLSNASGRQLNVASSKNLYLGQKVTLQSNTQIPTSRRIINIERINDLNYLISLDGQDDLDYYTVLDGARLKAYLPGTINSENQIFIPSNLSPSNTVNTREISDLSKDSLVGLSKIDWLLQDSGDIALDVYGDIKLASGLTNLVQALKLKFLVPAGKLLKHPEFGTQIKAGVSAAEINASDVMKQVKEAILADKRFSSIQKLEVVLNGPKLTINVAVGYNKNEVLPLSFSVNI